MAEMDSDREIRRVNEQADRAAKDASEQFSRAGSLNGTATAPDGAVSVTVSPGGMLIDVKISPLALRGNTNAVAQQVMDLAATATKRAGDKMYRALAPVLGPDGAQELNSLGYEPLPDDELDDEVRYQHRVR